MLIVAFLIVAFAAAAVLFPHRHWRIRDGVALGLLVVVLVVVPPTVAGLVVAACCVAGIVAAVYHVIHSRPNVRTISAPNVFDRGDVGEIVHTHDGKRWRITHVVDASTVRAVEVTR